MTMAIKGLMMMMMKEQDNEGTNLANYHYTEHVYTLT